MEGDHRRRINERLPDDSERPSRGPRRRTRDSGAVDDTPAVKGRGGDIQEGQSPLSVPTPPGRQVGTLNRDCPS